jgi:uncharacterized repeat protein (TIGR03806 family)
MASVRHLGLAVVMASGIAAMGACGDDGGGGASTPVPTDDGGMVDAGPPPPVRAEFGLDARPTNATCKAPARPPSTAPVKFVQVFSNVSLAAPMMMAQIPGDGSRWFVAQRGLTVGGNANLVAFSTNNPPAQTTIVGQIGPLALVPGGEGGLLGLAFHPKFAQNGKLYVTWTRQGGINGAQSEVGVLTSTDNGATFGNYQPVLVFDQTTASNHKGGGIAFGKDGYLYASFGDGGNANDAYFWGQKKTGFFSKVLRIDVDNPAGGKAYGIPATNPFAAGGGGDPEVFAWGFRNPYRISVDRDTNQLWVGDVGQNEYEEIDKVVAGGNYGWPCREGFHDYYTPDQSTAHCPTMNGLSDPVVELHHVPNNSRAVTGGVVYRGKAIPSFVGTYVFADYVKQELWAISVDPATGKATPTQLNTPDPVANWVSFAEDADGEVYALALNQGTIYKMVPGDGAPTSTFPDRLSKTGCVDPNDPKKPAQGVIPFGVNAALWSDGAKKDRYIAIPDGATIAVKDDGDFATGSVLMKTFTVAGKRTETRLFIRHDDGNWGGYSYEWLDDESDAVLLPSSKSKAVGAQTWYYPSRGECLSCHSEAAGRSLGPELAQLNGDFVYADTNRISNQLKTLDHIGMFAAPLGKPVDQILAYPDPLGTGPADARARAYLHANCSGCHRPNGPGLGDMDLRFGTAFADTKTCNVDPVAGDTGVAGAKRVVPGDPSKSLVSLRPHSPLANRMPPLGTSIVDDKGLTAIDDWIRGLTGCP